MYKMAAILTVFLQIMSCLNPAFAMDNSSVVFTLGKNFYIKGAEISMDAAPFMQSGRVYVPVRYLGEALNLTVKWNPQKNEIILFNPGSSPGDMNFIKLQPGIKAYLTGRAVDEQNENTVAISYAKGNEMDVAPLVSNGRTYLPARYIAETFGYGVEWDNINGRVIIGNRSKIPEGWQKVRLDESNISVYFPAKPNIQNIASGDNTKTVMYSVKADYSAYAAIVMKYSALLSKYTGDELVDYLIDEQINQLAIKNLGKNKSVIKESNIKIIDDIYGKEAYFRGEGNLVEKVQAFLVKDIQSDSVYSFTLLCNAYDEKKLVSEEANYFFGSISKGAK